MFSSVRSIPDVVDVLELGGGDGPALVIEVPHGATGDWEFNVVASQLRGAIPDDLIAFFHVNTDAGAAELGLAIGQRVLAAAAPDSAAGPAFSRVLIVRCRIPRTFVDCNRVLGASGAAYRAGGVTPGVAPWITDEADHDTLLARYVAYQTVAQAAIDVACAAGGRALLLHTYAPRSVDVQVSLDIVRDLRAAYANPEQWPLRPEIDVIHRDPDGVATLTPAGLAALGVALTDAGYLYAEGETYPLHPVTMAHAHVTRHPGQVACLEVRRDLLTEQFVPFWQVQVDPLRVSRVAAPLARWLMGAW
jgi:hypothetical protein